MNRGFESLTFRNHCHYWICEVFNQFVTSNRDKMKPYKLAEVRKDKDYYTVVFHFRHPITGKNKRFILKGGVNRMDTDKEKKEAAIDLAAETNARLKSGQINERNLFPKLFAEIAAARKEYYTVKSAFEHVDQLKQAQFSKGAKGRDNHTYSDYKSTKNRLLTWARESGLISHDINSITQQHLYRFMDWAESKYRISDVTYNNYIKKLSVYFTAMYDRGIIDHNPLLWDSSSARNKKMSRRKVGYGKSNIPYTEEEKRILHEKLPNKFYELYVCWQTCYYTGRRIKEITKMQIYSISKNYDYFILGGDISKTDTTAAIPITKQLRSLLLSLELHKYPDHYYIFSKPKLRPSETKICINTVFKHWRKHVKAPAEKGGLGLNIGMYKAKHTRARDLLETELFDLEDIYNLFGHKDFATTRRYAATVSPRRLKKIIDHSPDFISSVPGKNT